MLADGVVGVIGVLKELLNHGVFPGAMPPQHVK